MIKSRDKIDELFDELVPSEGKADTVAGEIIRAITRLCYRFYNDGDQVSVGYGNETCNYATRFLEAKLPAEVKGKLDGLWGWQSEDEYEKKLDEAADAVVAYIEAHPELKRQENEEDMRSYFNKDVDTGYEDEEDEWDDEDWDDDYEDEDEYEDED